MKKYMQGLGLVMFVVAMVVTAAACTTTTQSSESSESILHDLGKQLVDEKRKVTDLQSRLEEAERVVALYDERILEHRARYDCNIKMANVYRLLRDLLREEWVTDDEFDTVLTKVLGYYPTYIQDDIQSKLESWGEDTFIKPGDSIDSLTLLIDALEDGDC